MSAAGGRQGVHATAAVFGEWGVLILGVSGAGKSALALALLARARDSGRYGALIGDDRIWLAAERGRVVARGAAAMAGRIELRPAGLVTVPAAPAAVVHLVVELKDREAVPRFPDAPGLRQIEGVPTPGLALDRGRSAADNALVVEERLRLMFRPRRGKTNFA